MNITEGKRAEEERAQFLSREQAARAEAERANRLKDEFLSAVSHELCAPLTTVPGWARMLRCSELDESTREEAPEIIERNVAFFI